MTSSGCDSDLARWAAARAARARRAAGARRAAARAAGAACRARADRRASSAICRRPRNCGERLSLQIVTTSQIKHYY